MGMRDLTQAFIPDLARSRGCHQSACLSEFLVIILTRKLFLKGQPDLVEAGVHRGSNFCQNTDIPANSQYPLVNLTLSYTVSDFRITCNIS